MAIKTHTIKAYLSGISFFSKLITGSSGLATSHPQITSLLKGLLCQEPAKNPCRLPLTADLLSICLHTIRCGYSTPQVAQTLEAMFLLAFFGFLRCSEFTSSTIHFDPSRHACISDLSRFSDDTMVFHLKQTKTNQFGPSTPVFFFKVQSPLNPFLQFCKSQSTTMTDPLRIRPSGYSILVPPSLLPVLSLSGISPDNYSGHSFRIGAATSASRNGIPEHFIRLPNIPPLHQFRSQRSQIHSIDSQIIGGFLVFFSPKESPQRILRNERTKIFETFVFLCHQINP